MGATNFFNIYSAPTAREAYDQLVAEAEQAYGSNPYSGTIATCDLGYCQGTLSDVFISDITNEAWNVADQNGWGEKWRADYLDLGQDPDNPDNRIWCFYGLAAT